MNIQTPLHFRALLLLLLLGAQCCGAVLIPFHSALNQQLVMAEHKAALKVDQINASLSTGDDFSPIPAILRFNGKTLVGLEDALTLFQDVEASADSPFDLMIDAASGLQDTFFTGSTALAGQSLFLQHTRLQI
jgi:hypothetical protein